MKIKKCKHIAERTISGQAYIVNTKTSMLHELDEVGTFIWNLIDHAPSPEKIVENLCKTYTISKDDADDDVIDFINNLRKKDIIEIDPRY